MKPLPLGRSTFSTLRARNEIYVDKTELIYRLAQFDSKIFWLVQGVSGNLYWSRPLNLCSKAGLRIFEIWRLKSFGMIKPIRLYDWIFPKLKILLISNSLKKLFKVPFRGVL